MHVAVNRVAPGREAEPLIADERIALSAALRAYTAGTARVNHADQTGRIAVGLLADLVVLDRDPFASPADAIHRTRVAAAYVDGQPVFQA